MKGRRNVYEYEMVSSSGRALGGAAVHVGPPADSKGVGGRRHHDGDSTAAVHHRPDHSGPSAAQECKPTPLESAGVSRRLSWTASGLGRMTQGKNILHPTT